jgi:hypothetical protein
MQIPVSYNPMGMKLPLGVTVIATGSSLAAAYLFTIAGVMLAAPGTISMRSGAPLMYGLELAGPYMTLLVATGWGLMGWGLFRLYNWARWAAMVVSIVGIAFTIPKVSAATDFQWAFVSGGLNIAVRAAVVWYLLQSPSVIENFVTRK